MQDGTLLRNDRWNPFSVLFFQIHSAYKREMPSFDVSDVARLRLEDISFFVFLLLLATIGIRFLWEFPRSRFSRSCHGLLFCGRSA